MSWGPFIAEAARLDTKLRKLHREGRTSDAIDILVKALRSAHLHGPSTFEGRASSEELQQ